MAYKIEDFYKAINEIADFSLAESWDNVGLLVGSRKTSVKSALVALDVTSAVIAEAKLLHAELIITHHPVIFPHISKIGCESPLYELISSKIAVISAHTNYDAASGGVNDALCSCLGLLNVRELESAESPGRGRIGELENPLDSRGLAAFVKERLGSGAVKYTPGPQISSVAVCGGADAELWRDALNEGAQAMITSEVKHHQLIEAAEARFTLIDAGHHATEAVAIRPLAERLQRMLPGASVAVSEAMSDPARYL